MTLEEAAERLADLAPGGVGLQVAHRDGEWSAVVTWHEEPATFETGGFKPTAAHANGGTLAQALETTIAEAERIRKANQG